MYELPVSSKQKTEDQSPRFLFGGDKRDRTADLLNAIQALSQLSYTPMRKVYISRLIGKCQEEFFLFPLFFYLPHVPPLYKI